MTLEQELELSYYRPVARIREEHGIDLVQDTRTDKFYVRKQLTTYHPDIYRYLQSHPVAHTPKIRLVAEEAGVLTVIEEYIPGDTLEELLEREGTFPEERVLQIAIALCRILSDFHHCDPPIINRDIKPSNIILTPDGVVKLLDLNTAKWSDRTATKDTVLLGTRGYAAPEQYGFGPSSVLSDIYAVGVLINVMSCGAFPNSRIIGGPLGQIVVKCVELSPSIRYPSIRDLQEALEKLSGEATHRRNGNFRKFLPPGFRSKNPVRYLFSALGYLLLFYCGLTLEVENAGPAEVILNRIIITLCFLSIVFFNGNYLGIQKHFRMTRDQRRWVRWLGMALVDFALISFWIILLNALVENFLR